MCKPPPPSAAFGDGAATTMEDDDEPATTFKNDNPFVSASGVTTSTAAVAPNQDDEVAALRSALQAMQAQLRSTEQQLEAKSLECEQLQFRLESVSFGDDSNWVANEDADKDDWQAQQQSNPWTPSRVQRAVEARESTVGRKEDYYSNNNNNNSKPGGGARRSSLSVRSKPLVTVIPAPKYHRYPQEPDGGTVGRGYCGFVPPPSWTSPCRRIVSAMKKERNTEDDINTTCNDDVVVDGFSVSRRNNKSVCSMGNPVVQVRKKGNVIFADEKAIFFKVPVCVDDFEFTNSESKEEDESKSSDDDHDDDFAMDIVDKWTSALTSSLSLPLPSKSSSSHSSKTMTSQEEKQDDDNTNTTVVDEWMLERVPSLREMMTNKTATTTKFSTQFSSPETVEC